MLADIHSNLAAFKAVLNDLELRGGAEEIWCLGDVVGYGPEPHECIELLRKHKHFCVAGNHDWAAAGKVDTAAFNQDAAAAARWTARQLSPQDIEYLDDLPPVIKRDDFTLVHGSPRGPIWEYILSVENARDNLAYFDTPFCFIGHSHLPLVFKLEKSGECSWSRFMPEVKLKLGKDRLIVNPGSVGQPRDGDPRASYAIYDSDAGSVILYRVAYEIHATQEKMKRHQLPARLAARLTYGV